MWYSMFAQIISDPLLFRDVADSSCCCCLFLLLLFAGRRSSILLIFFARLPLCWMLFIEVGSYPRPCHADASVDSGAAVTSV